MTLLMPLRIRPRMITQVPMRLISLTEAERLFTSEAKKLDIKLSKNADNRSTSQQFYSMDRPGSGLSQQMSDGDLKRVYLQFAKVYHPDVQKSGNKVKFQKLTEAYERLKADKAGYTLTEEDLYDLYKNQKQQ